ncbi:uncharacterized protein Triagg1_3022 [Trichoderma aggressivum f. europaeum]|uniref:Uncharacterized protein n=1 Tax=Trichoderma aggressivum f. europaeum TaxID=173218 RepID=A0AAE1M2P6_9HYPO|nr:hypothetical protein Triagg1_3022 [Trichoderma aggressivum f. europaeum]
MSSRTAFTPSSSSLATAKGTRHPAAIPPGQNSPCKRTSALLELELKLIKSHGQMLAHAPRSPALPVLYLRRFLPQSHRTDRERLADLHRTRRHTLAWWRLRASASTGNLCSHFGGRRNAQRHATLAMPSWALSWVLDPDLWMALGCGSSLEASSLRGCERSGRQSMHSASPGPPNAQLML